MIKTKNISDSTFGKETHQSWWKALQKYLVSIIYYFGIPILKKNPTDFIFIVHTRYDEDYDNVFPFYKPLRIFLSPEKYRKFLEKQPPLLVDKFKTVEGFNGLMITTLVPPTKLIAERSVVRNEINRILKFIQRCCIPNHDQIVLSLGAWWPMATKKGMLFNKLITEAKLNYRVTTGHSVTVFSIVKMSEWLIKKSPVKSKMINVAILGCGNIGQTVAKLLMKHNVNFTFIDINEKKLKQLKKEYESIYPKKKMRFEIFSGETIKGVLSQCIFGVCATSNVKSIINKKDIPKNFIFIDDSRPEAIPRFLLKDDRYTIEGGLLRVKGARSSFNIGFGNDDNLLGCLAEGLLLAWDSTEDKVLKETIGSVDDNNLQQIEQFCNRHQLRFGDFKMGSIKIDEQIIENALYKRNQTIKNTVKKHS